MNVAGSIPLSFTTDRFLIRRYRVADDDNLFNAARASIPEVFEFLPWCHPDYVIDETRQWLGMVESSWRNGTAYNFAIFTRDEKELLGGCGINRVDEHPIGNLGYWIKTSATGKGIATEATVHLARFGIEKIGLQRIEIIMSTNNEASRRVTEGAGAKFEGTLRNRLQLHGKQHDAHIYSITPEDLTA